MALALTGARIFDGARLIDGSAVIVDRPTIAAVVPAGDLPTRVERRAVDGLIAPGRCAATNPSGSSQVVMVAWNRASQIQRRREVSGGL